MSQISENMDVKLNSLSREITAAEKDAAEATGRFNQAWEEVINTFDEFYLEGQEARFIASDGRVLYKQTRGGTPKFDAALFQQKFFEHFGEKANSIWNTITKRVLDMNLLEQAKLRGKVPSELIAECIATPDGTFARMHPEWTKADSERALILGIEKEE